MSLANRLKALKPDVIYHSLKGRDVEMCELARFKEIQKIAILLAEAHDENSDEDYRGNRSNSSVKSYKVLKESLKILEKK